jgi:branched-subunit amino acid transport protein
VSWWPIVLLGVGAYAFKAVGLVVLGGRQLPAIVDRCLALIPAALMAAIVVGDTFASGQDLQVDARAAGVAAAVFAAWRRAPLIVVIAVAALVTALLRQVS